MTESDDVKKLMDVDWSTAWESLPEAPDLVPRGRTAQVTLRLPASLVDRVRRIGQVRDIPYHALVRSWLLDEDLLPMSSTGRDERQDAQVNVKLAQERLDDLKRQAAARREPYHRLARERIESGVAREESAYGIASKAQPTPTLQQLMVLLLHARGPSGSDAIRGMTRLQKLLFVIDQHLDSRSGFHAHNYGPFNESVNDAASALRIAGLIGDERSAGPPSFDEMIAHVERHSGPAERAPELFALTSAGHAAAERLRRSNRQFEQLFRQVSELRRDWDASDLNDLVVRVYEEYPEFAENSLIREDVAKWSKKPKP